MIVRIYLETDLNRVFTKSLGELASAELDVVLTHRLGAAGAEISTASRRAEPATCGSSTTATVQPLVDQLAMLSATAAVFVEHSTVSLEPLPLDGALAFGTELVTTQRYKGKTNERLTRLMLNLAVRDRCLDGDARPIGARPDVWPRHHAQLGAAVRDPCHRARRRPSSTRRVRHVPGAVGEGQPLSPQAPALQEAEQRKPPLRLHRGDRSRRRSTAKRAPDVRTFNAPADDASVPVGRHAMIVSDLPYGIQHQPRSAGDRSPTSVAELVANVSGRWPEQIRTGGSVALSWNVKSLSEPDMAALLDAAGSTLVATAGFESSGRSHDHPRCRAGSTCPCTC